MKNKYNLLEEVSFNIKGQKVYGIISKFQQVVVEDKVTFSYDISLIRPLIFDGTSMTVYQMLSFEDDLTLEKFPMSEAEQSNIPIVI